MTRVFFLWPTVVCAAAIVNSSSTQHPLPSLSLQLQRMEPSGHGRRRRYLGEHDSENPPEVAPIFPGYGTHYAYVYVGTPPQRQSVIIDTGSHYTAFPCTGCSRCGDHTDPYYDLDKSSTKSIPKCGSTKCTFSQSYAEGSSWHAYKVLDKMWVGGQTEDEVLRGSTYSVQYSFGCQTSETGLFETQLENGIMGMSMGTDSLASQLHAAGITESTVFSLCFSFDGGVLTMGGVDPSIHRSPTSPVKYAKLYRRSDWYGVKVLDMRLLRRDGSEQRITASSTIEAAFKGSTMSTIVDSGTTDTYLPSVLLRPFSAAFKEVTGVDFKTGTKVSLTKAQMASFPDLLVELEARETGSIIIRMPWVNYVEQIEGTDKFEFVLFFQEQSGAILGANFMDGHNVIFDQDGGRVGFAESDCDFDALVAGTAVSTVRPTPFPTPDPLMPPEWTPAGPCDAQCGPESGSKSGADGVYSRIGAQSWLDMDDGITTVDRTCTIHCSEDDTLLFLPFGHQPILGNSSCGPSLWGVWGECSESCRQTLTVLTTSQDDECLKDKIVNRDCHSGACLLEEGAVEVYIKLLFAFPISHWSIFLTVDFENALSAMFKVPATGIAVVAGDILQTLDGRAVFPVAASVRGRGDDADILDASVSEVDPVTFTSDLLRALDAVSMRSWDLDYSVYGWMDPKDLALSNMTTYRQPFGFPHSSGGYNGAEETFSSMALGAVFVVCLGVSIALVYACCRAGLAPEEPIALYSKVETSEGEGEVELSGLRAELGVDMSDAQLDVADVNSGRV